MSLFDLWRRKQIAKQPVHFAQAPESKDENPRHNVVGVNDQEKFLEIRCYYNDDESIQKALGTLEIAKDIVKGKMVEWRSRQRRMAIVVPSNGRPN